MTTAALFVTCVLDVAAPDVGFDVVSVLEASGHEVCVPTGQTCCGQPAWNSGYVNEAAKVAKTSLDAMAGSDADVVVVPAGSCTTMMRLYWPQLFALAGDEPSAARARELAPRIRELTEVLADATTAATPPTQAQTSPVAYHHSCHMLRELHLHDAPLAALEAAGCPVVEWPDAERCCGFGGAFSVKLPETSVAMADEKLASLPTEATALVGADLSCLMHLRARAERQGLEMPVRHIAEVLAERQGGSARS